MPLLSKDSSKLMEEAYQTHELGGAGVNGGSLPNS